MGKIIHQYCSPPPPFTIETKGGRVVARVDEEKLILFSASLIRKWTTSQETRGATTLEEIRGRKRITDKPKGPLVIWRVNDPESYDDFINRGCLDLVRSSYNYNFVGNEIEDWIEKIKTPQDEDLSNDTSGQK